MWGSHKSRGWEVVRRYKAVISAEIGMVHLFKQERPGGHGAAFQKRCLNGVQTSPRGATTWWRMQAWGPASGKTWPWSTNAKWLKKVSCLDCWWIIKNRHEVSDSHTEPGQPAVMGEGDEVVYLDVEQRGWCTGQSSGTSGGQGAEYYPSQ